MTSSGLVRAVDGAVDGAGDGAADGAAGRPPRGAARGAAAGTTVVHEHSAGLDAFLALQRELMGRFAWEYSILPRPVEPGIVQFRDGIRAWRREGLETLPRWIATAGGPQELTDHVEGAGLRDGTRKIADALTGAGPVLREALAALAPGRDRAVEGLGRLLDLPRTDGPLREALGVPAPDEAPFTLPLYLVPLAPHPPASGFLTEGGDLAAAYIDCRRFTGTTLADGVLTLLGWALLKSFPSGPRHLSREVAARLPGATPYKRRLRAVLTKILVEMTAGHLIRAGDPGHRDCVDVLGTAWRYPRLHAVAERHWTRFLTGLADRSDALSAMAGEISRHSPRWYIDHVDASALAADFYLMEWLSAAGDRSAARRLAEWLPQLGQEFAGQLDLIIGAELGHYERVRPGTVPAPLAAFLREVTTGDSRVAWPRTRSALGQARALDLACRAFAGPGAEYGGEAWAPVAGMLRRYTRRELPLSVFVDQCFTLEHNNGSLFDKYCDTDHVLTVLDAQAAGDVDTLAEHASPEVRGRWDRYRRQAAQGYDTTWLGGPDSRPADGTRSDGTTPADGIPRTGSVPADGSTPTVGAPADGPADRTPPASYTALTVRDGEPGAIGSGSSLEISATAPDRAPGPREPVHTRRPVFRRPFPLTLHRYQEARASLRTGLGDIEVRLWPRLAPYTVDNFVGLARGTRDWTDPLSGERGAGGFYDGTDFHRRLPGFLVQGGDRSGTGQGGPGYRIPEEVWETAVFDRPFLLAMANSGKDSTGSQFFITLAAAPHLNGLYTQFGEVRDPASRHVAAAVAGSTAPVRLHTVDIVAS
ncbi:peptidylprolyl isomerase [Streptomyces sp. NBC_00963]|uniref:peptidylprolyl isomerase n=1 Tax=Streptomyces sp. NBC_00963 TaxID=2903697 RepID=UPI0038639FCC|nr:peptidylprolyl isomerase [Streptomyces sp. NBC_00963]